LESYNFKANIERNGFQVEKVWVQKKKILIERENIVNWRCACLQQIRKFRETGKPILYQDETWVAANFTFRKCWQNKKL
jgi:hypothetical protein